MRYLGTISQERLQRRSRMTKSNLIDHLAETMQSTKKEAEQVIDAVLGQITEALPRARKSTCAASAVSRRTARRSDRAETRRRVRPLRLLPERWPYLSRARNWPNA